MKSSEPACQYELMAARDALEVIQGKWRIPIIISLTYGTKRFGEIQRDISDISPKMLSQELKALELNQIITRTMYDSMPVSVEYSLTALGMSLKNLLVELRSWGKHLRKEVVGKWPIICKDVCQRGRSEEISHSQTTYISFKKCHSQNGFKDMFYMLFIT